MKLKARVTLTLRDKRGRVIKERSFRSRSYVLAMLDILYVQMAQVAQTILDISDTNQSVTAHASSFNTKAGAGTDTYSMVVGTGTTAVAIADNKLVTQIMHGTTAGKLVYGTELFTAPATSGSTRSFTIYRTFSNSSGATITVRECGIYVRGYSAGVAVYCAVRDLISGGQAVLDGQALTITYTIGVTV